MAEYIACRNCESPDCKGCNLKRLETMLENGKFDCMMNENRCINTSADVEPVQEWIPVDERLPEEKVDCIVHYKHAYCNNDGYWAIGFCFYDSEKFRIDLAYKVTHWMPLPEPPKGE